MKRDRTRASERQGWSGPTLLEAILVVVIACGAALLIWVSLSDSEKAISSTKVKPTGVIQSAEHVRSIPHADSPPVINEKQEATARSEFSAVLPPSGGPTTADVRRKLVDLGTSFDPSYVRGELRGFRLSNVSTALAAEGFRDEDLLVRVDGRTAGEGPGQDSVSSTLTPGVIVDVERNGMPISWRLGSSPL